MFDAYTLEDIEHTISAQTWLNWTRLSPNFESWPFTKKQALYADLTPVILHYYAEAQKNKNWDPNAPMYGKNPAPAVPVATVPGTPASGAKAAGKVVEAKPDAKADPKADAKADPKAAAKPDAKADAKASADPLGDLAKAKTADAKPVEAKPGESKTAEFKPAVVGGDPFI